MFEKEAKEYLKKDGTKAEQIFNMLNEISPLKITSKQVPFILAMIQQTFQDGAEFGYNKANEWHFIKNRDFPVREDYYVIACHSATGDFTDRCQWLNNEWWSADGEVKHFINEKVYAWKEKSQPPKESE